MAIASGNAEGAETRAGLFATTRGSLVLIAGGGSSPQARTQCARAFGVELYSVRVVLWLST